MTVDLHINNVVGPCRNDSKAYCSLPPEWCDREARTEFTRFWTKSGLFPVEMQGNFYASSTWNRAALRESSQGRRPLTADPPLRISWMSGDFSHVRRNKGKQQA
jgi:hypothetical protein